MESCRLFYGYNFIVPPCSAKRIGGQWDLLGIMQEVSVWSYEQMVYAQPRTHHRKWDAINCLGFWDKNGSSNLGQTTRPNDSQEKKENLPNDGLCRSGLHQGKAEKSKCDKHLDRAWELKKLWNMKVTVIPVVNGSPDTVIKGFLLGLQDLEKRGRVETIQTTALLISTIISWRIHETWADLFSLRLQWKAIS